MSLGANSDSVQRLVVDRFINRVAAALPALRKLGDSEGRWRTHQLAFPHPTSEKGL